MIPIAIFFNCAMLGASVASAFVRFDEGEPLDGAIYSCLSAGLLANIIAFGSLLQ